MKMKLSERAIIHFLNQLESGKITLKPESDPYETWGTITYHASNGWILQIFNDAGNWDYLESIVASDHRSASFRELDKMQMVREYFPSQRVLETQFRF